MTRLDFGNHSYSQHGAAKGTPTEIGEYHDKTPGKHLFLILKILAGAIRRS